MQQVFIKDSKNNFYCIIKTNCPLGKKLNNLYSQFLYFYSPEKPTINNLCMFFKMYNYKIEIVFLPEIIN